MYFAVSRQESSPYPLVPFNACSWCDELVANSLGQQHRWPQAHKANKHKRTSLRLRVSKWNGTEIHSFGFGCTSSWPFSWPMIMPSMFISPQHWNGLNSEGDMTLSPSLSSRSKTAFQAAHVSSGTSLESASYDYLPLFSTSISSLSTICLLWGNCAATRIVAMGCV